MGKLATLGADSMDVTDIYESEGYKVLRDFYERLPIAITTKQVLDQRAAILEKLAAADSLAKQEEIIARLLKDEKELLDADPVYVRVEDYIQKIAAANLQDADSLEEQVKEDEGAEKKDDTGSEKTIGPEVTGYYDTLVNQRGDVVFLDSRARQQTPNYITALYAKDWTHVGLYAGSSMVYDSHPAPCGGRNHGGVGLRPANAHFFRSGSRVMLAQLSTSSKRWTEGRALDQAQASTRFGDDCRTPSPSRSISWKASSRPTASTAPPEAGVARLLGQPALPPEYRQQQLPLPLLAHHQSRQRAGPPLSRGISPTAWSLSASPRTRSPMTGT